MTAEACPRLRAGHYAGANAEAWCLLKHADASLSSQGPACNRAGFEGHVQVLALPLERIAVTRRGAAAGAGGQWRTLVHFSAQREHFLWDTLGSCSR